MLSNARVGKMNRRTNVVLMNANPTMVDALNYALIHLLVTTAIAKMDISLSIIHVKISMNAKFQERVHKFVQMRKVRTNVNV